ncbi:hypothetical protein R1flu_010680 [Riccia fluitans]|uniref:Uncharacterized protein n=1 Tax=Riccia fluitans TaxID=41844 RepID=A0ABD1Z5N8_9MARC
MLLSEYASLRLGERRRWPSNGSRKKSRQRANTVVVPVVYARLDGRPAERQTRPIPSTRTCNDLLSLTGKGESLDEFCRSAEVECG